MSTDLIRAEPEPRALAVPEPAHDLHPVAPPAPPPEDAARCATTWDPRDRVPRADAEAEC